MFNMMIGHGFAGQNECLNESYTYKEELYDKRGTVRERDLLKAAYPWQDQESLLYGEAADNCLNTLVPFTSLPTPLLLQSTKQDSP